MKHCVPARSGLWLVAAVAALVTAPLVPHNALGAERMVLIEEFTSTG